MGDRFASHFSHSTRPGRPHSAAVAIALCLAITACNHATPEVGGVTSTWRRPVPPPPDGDMLPPGEPPLAPLPAEPDLIGPKTPTPQTKVGPIGPNAASSAGRTVPPSNPIPPPSNPIPPPEPIARPGSRTPHLTR